MKKSLKKACAVALLVTSTTAFVGANAFAENKKNVVDANVVFADSYVTAGDLYYFEIAGKPTTATVGSPYEVAEAKFYKQGTVMSGVTCDVTGPNGEKVNLDANNQFEVKGIGNYTITYKYNDGTTDYVASYKVKGEIGKTTVETVDNTQRILPKYVYESFTGDIYVPEIKVYDDNHKEIDKSTLNITTTVSSPSGALTFDESTGKLNFTSLEQGTYFVKYVVKTNENVYLNSLSKEFTVLSDTEFEKEYKKDYQLKFEFSKSNPESAEIGDPLELPTVQGKLGTETTPVYYTIEAKLLSDGQEVDVTAETISGNKFTAKKSYTIAGKTYNAENAKYQFYYNVTDALGKKAEKTGFMISGVKDTLPPEIMVVDPYDVSSTDGVKDVAYKLATKFQEGKNVVLKAMYAVDLADVNLSDLTSLSRYIRKDGQSSKEENIYDDTKSEIENIFAKDIVFNATRPLTANEVDGGNLEDGTYTVYYEAVDKAGHVGRKTFNFEIDSNFDFEKAPKVEFADTFTRSVSKGTEIKVSEPTATCDDDDRLFTQLKYKFEGDSSWTLLTKEAKVEKYSFKADKDGAKYVIIRAVTESDAPVVAGVDDVEIDDITTYTGVKYGFSEVKINITENNDSAAPVIESMGTIEDSYQQNTDVELPYIEVSDDYVNNVNVTIFATHRESGQKMSVRGASCDIRVADTMYKKSGAKFYATLAGDYDIEYHITDAGNNKLVVYLTTNVTANPIVAEPRFSKLPESLAGGKLELGKSIELPIPELPSEDYDYTVNVKDGEEGYFINKETFKPENEGSYTIVYDMFKKGEESTILDTREFKVEVTDTTAPEVNVAWDLNGYYALGSEGKMIPVFFAEDISETNTKDSKIVISSTKTYKNSSKTIYQYQFAEELEKGSTGSLFIKFDKDEEYTITYTVYDNSKAKNSTVKTFKIKVGDLVAPVIDVKDDTILSSYKINQKLTIDMAKVTVTDDKTEDIKIDSIVVKNTTTGKELENIYADEENKYEFNITEAGDYTVTFKAKDDAGNEKVVTKTFSVNENENKPLETNEVIAIVACCVAVCILAGAIVYMVVTKKKMQSYK